MFNKRFINEKLEPPNKLTKKAKFKIYLVEL